MLIFLFYTLLRCLVETWSKLETFLHCLYYRPIALSSPVSIVIFYYPFRWNRTKPVPAERMLQAQKVFWPRFLIRFWVKKRDKVFPVNPFRARAEVIIVRQSHSFLSLSTAECIMRKSNRSFRSSRRCSIWCGCRARSIDQVAQESSLNQQRQQPQQFIIGLLKRPIKWCTWTRISF